jgi:hypothetical protein
MVIIRLASMSVLRVYLEVLLNSLRISSVEIFPHLIPALFLQSTTCIPLSLGDIDGLFSRWLPKSYLGLAPAEHYI